MLMEMAGSRIKLWGKSVPRQQARWAERPWTERRGWLQDCSSRQYKYTYKQPT